MHNLFYGLINDLLFITSLVELFRDIFHSFLKSLIVRTYASDALCKTVWDILAAMRCVATCRQDKLDRV